jgi:hypothetical protein
MVLFEAPFSLTFGFDILFSAICAEFFLIRHVFVWRAR